MAQHRETEEFFSRGFLPVLLLARTNVQDVFFYIDYNNIIMIYVHNIYYI